MPDVEWFSAEGGPADWGAVGASLTCFFAAAGEPPSPTAMPDPVAGIPRGSGDAWPWRWARGCIAPPVEVASPPPCLWPCSHREWPGSPAGVFPVNRKAAAAVEGRW